MTVEVNGALVIMTNQRGSKRFISRKILDFNFFNHPLKELQRRADVLGLLQQTGFNKYKVRKKWDHRLV